MSVLRLACGTSMTYRVEGPDGAPSLIFVNALGTDTRLWQPVTASLGGSLRVVRYDTRGHGRPAFSDRPLTIDLLAQDLLALIDHLDIDRANVCGLSLGGMTVLQLAAASPQRIARAVLANTGLHIGTAALWESRIAAVRRGGLAAIGETVIERALSSGFRARRPDVAALVANMLASASPEGYIAACGVLRDADLRPLAGSIRAPSLIIAGAQDRATPPSLAAELKSAVGDSHTVMLDAAHLSCLEQPEVFARHLVTFLSDAGSTADRVGSNTDKAW